MSTLGNKVDFGKFFKLDNIIGTGDSSYTLLKDGQGQTNLIAEQLLVSVNGTIQNPGSAFTLNNGVITFAEAIDSTDTIDFITVMGEAHSLATVSDGAITPAKLSSNLGVTSTPVRINSNRISSNFTLDSSNNAMVTGPITIDSGVSVVLNGSFTVI
tara:strand:+ start:339 stop:809 length:471 start_codon:yes stop_codon:yes gene_type:complete